MKPVIAAFLILGLLVSPFGLAAATLACAASPEISGCCCGPESGCAMPAPGLNEACCSLTGAQHAAPTPALAQAVATPLLVAPELPFESAPWFAPQCRPRPVTGYGAAGPPPAYRLFCALLI